MAMRNRNDKEEQIDFSWLYYIAAAKMGFTHREAGFLSFGRWTDFFETYKKQYNFEKRKLLYTINEAEPISTLDAI